MNAYLRAETAHTIASHGVDFHYAWEISTCIHKGRFDTCEQAQRAADLYREKRGYDNEPYRCPVCNAWHLTAKKTEEDEEER